MDLSFTKSQELLQKAARQFAENELEPRAAAIDDAHTFPMDTFRLMARYGYTGIGVPVEYGGVGGGSVEEVIAVTEFAKKCMASAATLSIHLITPHILTQFGTEEQKKKYLPRLTKGGEVAAFALTEPNAGSDAASASTTAIYDPDTDEYVLNGTKCFITGGSRASVLIIFALTEPQKGLKGMSAIIVEDCRVPAANLVGRPGQGFKMAMMALDSARIGTGAQAVGIAEGAIDLSVKYMHERVQFGKPIAALQGLQWYIADMATKTEAAKWLVYRAAYLHDTGKPYSKESAMCKLNASENARFVTNLALQIHGGYGYMHDYPLERMYRDAKLTEIYEGTSEIHKVVISRAVLGK